MTDAPHDDEGPLRERIIALEAENARLREALDRWKTWRLHED